MSGEEQDDKFANRRIAILAALLGLPGDEAINLLAENIVAVLHIENVKVRSAEYIDFEATLMNMISARLEAMAGESPLDLSADAEPDALHLSRVHRQMVAPLLPLPQERSLDILLEAIARLLYDSGMRSDAEEITKFGEAFGDSVSTILEHLDAESDPEVEQELAEREQSDATIH